MPILPPLPRPQRRRIHKIIHATRDKGHARRLMAILLLHEGRTITDVHHLTGAARSTIGRWLRWYRDEGIDALEALPAGRAPVLPIAKIVTLLVLLMQFSPQDFGYQRSRWCTELLAIKINRLTVSAAKSTYLPSLYCATFFAMGSSGTFQGSRASSFSRLSASPICAST